MADASGGGGGGGGGGGAPAAPAATTTHGRHVNAFTVEPVMEEKRVVCLEAWSHYALLGLSDGTLLLASQRATSSSPAGSSTSVGNGEETNAASRSSGGHLGASSQGPDAPAGQQQQPGGQKAHAQWVVTQSLRGLATGRVKQLVVARERSMLLCLADDGVNAYVLPGMRLKGQAGRTRGASLFAWHGPTDTLAVAVKRRVILFKYDGLEFVEQREASLPDAPACMALAGGTLYVGLAKRDYVALDVSTGILSALFATKGPTASVVAVPPSEVLLGRDSTGVLYGPDGRPSKRGGGGGGRGVPRQQRGAVTVPWLAPPLALATSGPYVVGLVEGGAEARLLEPLNSADLWQQLTLTLPRSTPACLVAPSEAEDGSVFVANRDTGAVLRLRPVSFVQQAEQLLSLGEYEEALAMAALAPPQQAQQRRQLEDQIHLAFGQQLFRDGQYDDAMLHFGMSSLAGPVQLLRLFPSLAPPKLLAAACAEQAAVASTRVGAQAGAQVESQSREAEGAAAAEAGEPAGEAFVAAVQVVMPYLLSHRSRLAAAATSPAQKPRAGGATSRQQAQQAQQAQQQQAQQGWQQQQTPKTAALPPPSAAAATPAAAEEEAGPSPASRAVLVQQQLEGSATAALLDTSLLLALLALPDSGALLRFVQRPNCVDLQAGQAALQGAGRYSELVALLETKGRHAAALELLHALSQDPESLPTPPQGASAELRGLPGVWAAVKYVCHMPQGERDLSLVSTHAKWMLAADPDAGLEMFGNMQPPLPPSAALPIVITYAPHLAGAYLESALSSGAAEPSAYEQELARIYLERLVGSSSGTADGTTDGTAAPGIGSSAGAAVLGAPGAAGTAAGEGPGAGDAAGAAAAAPEALPEYGKLRQLILSSRHLDYEALLRVVPQRRLLEVRAALLERLGRHTEALRIYVHRLHQPLLAEAYCDRVYQRRQLLLREQRHAELAAALRRQRSQREAAAEAASSAGVAGVLGSGGGPAGLPYGSSSGSGTSATSTGSMRSLQFGGGPVGAGSAGAYVTGGGAGGGGALGGAATRLQPAFSCIKEDGADVYLLLVQVLLEEEDASGSFRPVQHAPDHAVWGEVARLLSRKRNAIHPLHALSLLPGEASLASALPFLEGALWGAAERRRAAAVARSLRRSEHIGLLGQLADARQRSVLLTPERNCSICFKRVGTAALVTFPSSLLAHYSCWRRTSGGGQLAGAGAGTTAAAAAAAAANGGGFGGREWH